MLELALLRQIYGSVYATVLPDGRYIPWKPLPLKDYLELEALRAVGTYTQSQLEDEVFRKCVLDELIVDRMDKLKAGTVSAVAATIFANSGPQSVDELGYIFNANRNLVQGVIHQMVSMICQAFPAYTPDDVYNMDYETMMQRAALAEEKLLRMGILNERIVFEQQGVPEEQQQQQQVKQKIDSKELFERYNKQQEPRPSKPVIQPPPSGLKQTVISTADMVEADAAYTGHERSDKILRETKMVDETATIYDDYLKQMRDGKKVVIPPHEERLRAAKARAEENKKKYEESLKQRAQVDANERAKLLEVREKARARKARKRR